MNADYFIHMGQKFAGERNWKAALEAFNRAIDLEKKDAEAYLGRGMVLYHLRKYQSALEDYNIAVELSPLHPGGYMGRGFVYQALHSYKQALEEYHQVVMLLPGNPEGYFRRGHIYMLIRKFPEALKDFESTLELNPQHADAHLDYGVVLGEMGDYEGALHELNAALNLQPRNAVIYYYQAQTYLKLERYDLAEAALKSFIGLSDHPVWTQRARIELENLQKKRSQNPTRIQLPADQKMEVMVMVKMGDKPGALKKVVEFSGAGLMTAKAYLEWLIQEEESGGGVNSVFLSNL